MKIKKTCLILLKIHRHTIRTLSTGNNRHKGIINTRKEKWKTMHVSQILIDRILKIKVGLILKSATWKLTAKLVSVI